MAVYKGKYESPERKALRLARWEERDRQAFMKSYNPPVTERDARRQAMFDAMAEATAARRTRPPGMEPRSRPKGGAT